MNDKETAVCRGCGKELRGEPYYKGGSAYRIDNGKRARVNFYGGFVCSRSCDFNSSLRLERTMPGHLYDETSIGCFARERLESNWSDER